MIKFNKEKLVINKDILKYSTTKLYINGYTKFRKMKK